MESGRSDETNGDTAKNTPSPVVDKSEEEAAVRCDNTREERLENTMAKQHDEDVEEGAQERMLKDENSAKITPTEKSAEVRSC